MVVVKDSALGERVPVATRTLHTDIILDVATKEIRKRGGKWQRGENGNGEV